jgi:hypothetical protein
MAGIAEQLQGKRVLRGDASRPEAHTQRHAQGPVWSDEQHEGQAIDGFTFLTRRHPSEALARRRQGRGKHRVLNADIAALAGDKRAPS